MAQLQRKGQEKLRGKIMEMVKRGLKTLRTASRELGISYSQAKRIYQRYLTGGDEALVHGNTGRPSNNKTDEGIVKKAVELYREHYYDFGPTLARETLAERNDLEMSVSTLRRALVSAGLWKQNRNGSAYRNRRTPRARFGELVQFDGSHHDWFEGRRRIAAPARGACLKGGALYRRCHQNTAVLVFRRRNHVWGDDTLKTVDRTARNTRITVWRPEKRLCPGPGTDRCRGFNGHAQA
jgi:transposase